MVWAHENPIIVLEMVIIKNISLELGKKVIGRVGKLKKKLYTAAMSVQTNIIFTKIQDFIVLVTPCMCRLVYATMVM